MGRVFVCDCGDLGTMALPPNFTDRGPAPGPLPLDVRVLGILAAELGAIQMLTEESAS